MRRREFIGICAVAPLAPWQHASAQRSGGKFPRIGILVGVRSENSDALAGGLQKAGYIDGQIVILETRFRGMSVDLADEFARELVALQCRVIFAADPYGIGAVI